MFTEHEATVVAAFIIASFTSINLPFLSLMYILAVAYGSSNIPAYALITAFYIAARIYVGTVRAVSE